MADEPTTKPADAHQGPGRPTKLTEQVSAALVELVSNGATYVRAAAHVGIHQETITDWIRRGAREEGDGLDTEFSRFYRALKKAEGSLQVEAEKQLKALVGSKDWRATKFVLERTLPGQYGQKIEHHHNIGIETAVNSGDNNTKAGEGGLPSDELAIVARILIRNRLKKRPATPDEGSGDGKPG